METQDAVKPTASTSILRYGSQEVITSSQVAILTVAIFIKGGLLGAYVPFVSLWLAEKGYNFEDIGLVSVVDAVSSLALPIVGAGLDKLRSHNLGFVVLVLILAVLKACYIPSAKSLPLILLLTAFTAPLLRASNSVLDALVLYAFQVKGNFSRVRLFGELGFGGLSFCVGLLYTYSGDIDVVFYLFSGMCFTLAILWSCSSRYLDNIRPDSKQMTTEEFCAQLHYLRSHVLNAGIGRSLFCLWLFGISLGIINTFELVLLKRLTGSGLLLGLCKLTGTVAAIPVWWFTPNMMKAIGMFNVQLIGLMGSALRLGILGVIENPWHALFSELFSGIGGFAIAYGAITIFAGWVTAEDMKGTAQTIIFVIYTGLGAGVASLVAGLYAHKYGLQNMFLAASALSATAVAVLVIHDLFTKYLTGSYRSLEERCKGIMLKDTPRLEEADKQACI
jgi:hypothetical protein